MVNILEAEGLTLTRAVADAISLHPCQCDGHSADTCPSAIAALAAVRKWDAEHAPGGWAVMDFDESGSFVEEHVYESAEAARHMASQYQTVVALVPVDGDGD